MVTFSPEMKQIYDVQCDQGMAADFFLDRIHPDDRPGFEWTFSEVPNSIRPTQCLYRVIFPDGSIKHIYRGSIPTPNQSGELVEFVGTLDGCH